MWLIQFFVILFLSKTVTCSVELNWVEGIGNYVSKHPDLYQVIFVSDNDNKALINIPGITELFRRIAEQRLIIHTSANNFDMFNNITQDIASTLFIYIHTPLVNGILPSTKIIDKMKDASLGRMMVKYIIIHYSDVKNDYLSETLKYAWRRQMLHCTILEILNHKKKVMKDNSFEIFIHHYNPFLHHFSTVNYSSQTELFPNTLDDMHGYPLTIGVKHNMPFSILTHQYDGNITASGANLDLINTLGSYMNFTVITRVQPKIVQSGLSHDIFLRPLRNGQLDIYGQLYAHIAERFAFQSMRTRAIDVDEHCVIVPYVIETHFSSPSMETIGGYLVAIVIVSLFWILEQFAHLDSHYWSPFIVIKLLFGVTVMRRPSRCADRIMFGALIIVSLVYSTKIYSSMTDGMVNRNSVNKWLTLEDLANSDLLPIISSLYYNKTFAHAEGVLLKIKAKVAVRDGTFDCLRYLVDHKNISCIMSRNEYQVFMQVRTKHNTELLSPCLWRDSTAFFMSQGSPYNERISKLITIFRDVGLKHKWYDIGIDRPNYDHVQAQDIRNALKNRSSVIQQCIIILTTGYTLATIALIGELIYYHKFQKKSCRGAPPIMMDATDE